MATIPSLQGRQVAGRGIIDENMTARRGDAPRFHTLSLVCLAVLLLTTIGCRHEPAYENRSYYVDGHKRDRVLVFVHGLTGTATETWRCPSGRPWPDVLRLDTAFDDWDIYVVDYRTRMIGNHVHVADLTEEVQARLVADKVWNHREVAFVCHSLGGVITQDLLLRYRKNNSKVSFVYLYGVPQDGAHLAALSKLSSQEKLITQLDTGSADLQRMEQDWRAAGFSIRRYCAFETEPVPNIGLIVPRESATRLCDAALAIQRDHIDLVKPCHNTDDPYIALRNAVDNTPPDTGWIFVTPLPRRLPALLENSPIKDILLGIADPLGKSARADVTQQRKGKGYFPPGIDRFALLSPAYPPDAVPSRLALPAGGNATMTVVAIEDQGDQSRVIDQSFTASDAFAWDGGGGKRVRFVVFLFPLSAEAEDRIRSEQPDKLVNVQP